jgi:hypothetical protein
VSFTYSSSSISTDLAKVRLTIGDTDRDQALLSDEEINYYLARKASVTLAAIDCVKAILAKMARDVDRNNLGMSATRSQKTQHYRDLLKDLQAESMTVGEVFVGGVSEAERESIEEDEDFEPGTISRDADRYE